MDRVSLAFLGIGVAVWTATAACPDAASDREDRRTRRAPSGPADAGSGPDARPAEAPAPLLRHGEHLHVFAEPFPGRGLRLLLGGPPYRLCEVEDLAGAAPTARCVDPVLPAGAENLEVVSLEEGAPTLLRAGRVLTEGPIFDAHGARRFDVIAQYVHAGATGPIAGIEITNARGAELLRFRPGQAADRVALPADREASPALFADRGLYRQGGHLRARRVLPGERPFGPVQDLGPAPAWSSVAMCRGGAGKAVALLTGELSRSAPNAGRVAEPGPGLFVFAEGETARAVTTTLPAPPHRLACDGEGASVVWVRTDRRPREQRRRHDVTEVRCTPAGCATTTAVLTGFAAWNPVAVDLGGVILLVRADGRAVRMRLAPLDQLGDAPDRELLAGTVEPVSIGLYPRGAHAAVLIDFPDHAVLLRVGRDGTVVPVRSEPELPPLPSGVPRFGAGPEL